MAAEYDINLSNGTVLATLHPLETNGPDNVSTPRLIQEARPSYIIQSVVQGAPSFAITGDFTDVFKAGFQFEVSTAGSPAEGPNDGTYTVLSSIFSSPNTVITVTSAIFSPTIHGSIIAHIFRLNSDVSYRFISGLTFDVSSSAISGSPATPGEIDGTYTVTALGPFFDGSTTIIPVAHNSIRDSLNIPIAVPYGEISYTVLDANTSLKLPGKGTPNYGEKIIEDLVRMVEHFASNSAPELNSIITGSGPAGDPLTGQLWYNTTAGSEGFKHWDGSAWTSDVTVGDGYVNFTDVENTAGSPANIANVYVTGSETNLPAPWMAAGSPALNLPGLVVWTDTDPSAGDPIFRVLSVDGNERLRVEHDGVVSTNNNLVVHGNATIEGDGIVVNADTGLDARIVIDAPTGQVSSIDFEINNVAQGSIGADGTDIVIASATDINLVATGNVGINQAAPSADLDVVGTTELNGKTNVVSADFIVGVDGTLTEIFSVDDSNSWVGVSTAIIDAFDVTDAMEVTGNLRINSQIFASQQSAADPTYSFTTAPTTGMFLVESVGGSPVYEELGFATNGILRFSITGTGALEVPVGYEANVLADTDIPNKKYVDDTSGYQSWREPVRVRDVTLYANQGAFPTSGTIDGVLLVDQDIVLFSNVTATSHKDIYIWNAGGSTWTPFSTGSPQLLRSVGDTVYVQEGSFARSVYAYGENREWNIVGSGSGINVRYEAVTAGNGNDGITFTLAEPYSVGTNRLTVYVDGVKQTLYDGVGGSPIKSDYEETDANTITFNQSVPATSIVEFYAYDELMANAVAKREEQTGLTGTPVINFGSLTYAVGGDNLLVFLNGQKMIKVTDYTETSSSSITWVGPTLIAADVLEFYSAVPIVAGTKLADIDNVASTAPADGNILAYNNSTSNWEGVAHVAAKPGYAEYLNQSNLGLGSPNALTYNCPISGGDNVPGGSATLQVFVNGVYQIQDLNYTYNGDGTITLFGTGSPILLPDGFDLVIYEFG